jgi:hypothetical protein
LHGRLAEWFEQLLRLDESDGIARIVERADISAIVTAGRTRIFRLENWELSLLRTHDQILRTVLYSKYDWPKRDERVREMDPLIR